ncbi:MAG: hypothetical protein H5U40_01940 [Polyangiaceae bacterium]|nr:hypothetical protein [Polyangiaceae bacterium]
MFVNPDWRHLRGLGLDRLFEALVPDGDALFVGGGFGYYDGETWASRAAFIDAVTGALR